MEYEAGKFDGHFPCYYCGAGMVECKEYVDYIYYCPNDNCKMRFRLKVFLDREKAPSAKDKGVE